MYQFGAIVEMEYKVLFGENGVYYYLALIVLGVIVPNLFDLMLHKNQPNYRSLGASGSVSAVLFAYVLFNPWSKLYLYGILPLYSIVAAVLYLVYSVYQDKKVRITSTIWPT
ncbi:MAG: rhomboid family intramembrane serine protease [Candidatus Parvibacillus calidus]|nr:MAG: rhomboid family intramembrane serine protease [Candidatus Parvibacillus calidus]